MKFQIKNIVFFLLLIVLSVVGVNSCNIDQRENEKITRVQYFSIEPDTIFDSLSSSEDNAFTLISVEPEINSSQVKESVNWNETHYLKLAEALHQLVWEEPLEKWNLYRMNFSLSCDEVENGFQSGQFVFFKVKDIDGQETRIAHFIEIDASRNFAQAMETQYSPNLAFWEPIKLTETKISASEALQIAEINGGHEKRLEVNNVCGISVGISRDTVVYDGWLVIYSPSVFIDKIDPVTGE